jgi:tRNA A37 N6-isopentenylltransferase MiaA
VWRNWGSCTIVWLSLTCLLHLLALLFVYSEADYTKGIFQAIGFKEFHQYLLLSEEDRNSEEGSKFFHAGVDALKLVTKRYARRQLRWINNRFLRKTSRQVGFCLTNHAAFIGVQYILHYPNFTMLAMTGDINC